WAAVGDPNGRLRQQSLPRETALIGFRIVVSDLLRDPKSKGAEPCRRESDAGASPPDFLLGARGARRRRGAGPLVDRRAARTCPGRRIRRGLRPAVDQRGREGI